MNSCKIDPIIIKTAKGLRKIGPGHPVFIVAEMSGNHNRSYKRALRLIDAASQAAVDAVKLQTYTADTITLDSDQKYFKITANNPWKGRTLYDLYSQGSMPWDWQPKLKKYAESKGLVLFSTPFDPSSVGFLEKMKVPLYKVASYEITDIPLLKRIGITKKPVILSRGMASIEEIKMAVKVLKTKGTPQVAILHCVDAYPTPPEEMNLSTIPDLIKRFKVISGISDHSLGINADVAAVASGASIIEKHFIISRKEGGPDSAFSLEPSELKELVRAVRATEKGIGKPSYKMGKTEAANVIFRKSLFVAEDIRKGERYTENNLRCIRPGHGLAPKHYGEILGRKASRDIKRGTPLNWDLIGQ